MEDAAIVSLYWQRDEAAIQETKTKYGAYLGKVAWNILGNQEDCEESVSDTYLRAWESMPPQRPSLLSAYLAKLTRQLSIDRFRHKNRQKRQGSQYALSLTELEDCLSGGDTTGQEVESICGGFPRRPAPSFWGGTGSWIPWGRLPGATA